MVEWCDTCRGYQVVGETARCAGCGTTEVDPQDAGHLIPGSVPDQCGPIEVIPIPCPDCVADPCIMRVEG